eukprot:Hpha_TRINITY_DN15714_c0_g1::TRINITY_DN15714_c0_g1_i1::g.36445::m.36445
MSEADMDSFERVSNDDIIDDNTAPPALHSVSLTCFGQPRPSKDLLKLSKAYWFGMRDAMMTGKMLEHLQTYCTEDVKVHSGGIPYPTLTSQGHEGGVKGYNEWLMHAYPAPLLSRNLWDSFLQVGNECHVYRIGEKLNGADGSIICKEMGVTILRFDDIQERLNENIFQVVDLNSETLEKNPETLPTFTKAALDAMMCASNEGSFDGWAEALGSPDMVMNWLEPGMDEPEIATGLPAVIKLYNKHIAQQRAWLPGKISIQKKWQEVKVIAPNVARARRQVYVRVEDNPWLAQSVFRRLEEIEVEVDGTQIVRIKSRLSVVEGESVSGSATGATAISGGSTSIAGTAEPAWSGGSVNEDGDAFAPPPLLSGAVLLPCGHNNWDSVRVRKSQACLRCRDCNAQVRIPSTEVTANKCADFLSRRGCTYGIQCSRLHVHRSKLRKGAKGDADDCDD